MGAKPAVAAWLYLPWRSRELEKNEEYAISSKNEEEYDRGKKKRNTLLRSLLHLGLGRGGPEQQLRFKLWWLGREKKRLV
jgi:hypothetical protein